MDERAFDLEEFKQSYAHYRHLEQERSRHLAFFFTLVGGLLGILGILLKDGTPVTDWFVFVACLTLVFLQILALVIFAAIRRMGDARETHRAQMSYLRGKLSSDTYVAQLWVDFMNRRYFSVHRAAEVAVLSFAAVFVIAATSGAIYAQKTQNMECWQAGVVLVLTLGLGIAQLFATIFLGTKKAHTRDAKQPNHGVQPTPGTGRG